MTRYDEIIGVTRKLSEYIECTFDENQELCELLIQLSRYPGYLRDEVWDVVAEELERQLEWYQDNYEIVTTKETFTRDVVELVEKQ